MYKRQVQGWASTFTGTSESERDRIGDNAYLAEVSFDGFAPHRPEAGTIPDRVRKKTG